MRNIYTLIALMIFAVSCKNIQKMVDKGEYDKAIVYAAEKLHGQKDRETKYVIALEDAFKKVMYRDLDKIAFLEAKDDAANWDRIYKVYELIDRRQNKIRPFLPLVAKDGYTAHFKFLNTISLMTDVGKKASNFHYNRAIVSLERARSGDKLAARRAHDRLLFINKYNRNYRDKEVLLIEARDLGMTRIILEMVNDAEAFVPRGFEEAMLNLDIYGLENHWIAYYNDYVEGLEMDLKSSIVIEEIDISPEREEVRRHIDQIEIVDGFEWVKEYYEEIDTNGVETRKYKKVKKIKYKTIKANVEEVYRHKIAHISGVLKLIDLETGTLLNVRNHQVSANFEDNGLYFYGDSRALCGKHSKNINTVESFPSDYELAMIATKNLKGKIRDDLYELVF